MSLDVGEMEFSCNDSQQSGYTLLVFTMHKDLEPMSEHVPRLLLCIVPCIGPQQSGYTLLDFSVGKDLKLVSEHVPRLLLTLSEHVP